MSTSMRRRDIRYKIKLPAIILVNNSRVRCIIHDFCSGGLLLEPLQSVSRNNIVPKQKIQIVFSVHIGDTSKQIEQQAKVMHICSKGIGVAFENNTGATFHALKQQAQQTSTLTSTEKLFNPTDRSKQKNLEADFSSLLKDALPEVIDAFYQRAEKELNSAVDEVKDIFKNNTLQDASHTLTLQKDSLIKNFCNVTQETYQITFSVTDQPSEINSDSSLSLIDKDDFEDWLNLSTAIRNLEALYELPLDQIQKKIAFIAGFNQNKIVNPGSPAKFCDKFREALDTIEDNPQAKQSLYAIFEQTLVKFLPGFYQKMDDILTKHGAPTKIEKNQDWLKINPGSSQIEPPPHIPEATPPGTQPDTQNSQSIIDAYDEMLASSAAINNSNKASLVQPIISGKKTKSVENVVSSLLNLVAGQNEALQDATITDPDSPEYSVEEISRALSQLQHTAISDNTLQHRSKALQSDLKETLDSLSTTRKHLSSTDKNNIKVYEHLFETLLNDMLLSDDIKPYIQSIHLPILDQAIQTPNFLESHDHPARNIINQLSWLDSAVKDNKIVKSTHIRQLLDPLIEEITEASLNDTAIFDSVEQKLEEIYELIHHATELNIKRVTEACEGKQNLEKARLSVQQELNQHLSGKQVPKIIITLLNKGWQHLLVIAKLNNDTSGFQKYLSIISNLNDWITGSANASEQQAESTLEFIDTQLQTVCTNTFEHSNILGELSDVMLKDPVRPDSVTVEMATFNPEKNDQSIDSVKPSSTEIDQLKVGDWLSFLFEDEDEFEPLKLVWIGDIQDLFLFVDRNGIKKLELQGAKLAEMISNDQAKNIENLDLPIIDRATNHMLQKMQGNIIDDAIHDPVTNLLNRKEFIKQLKLELTKQDTAPYMLCNIEIQDFRIITNACGLSGGDILLKQLADSLTEQQHETEIFARLDDKTFSVLLKNSSNESTEAIAKKIQLRLINTPFTWLDKSYAIAVSIGIVPLSADKNYDIHSLLQKVDSATLSAQNAGRNRIQVYKDDDESLKSQHIINEWAGRINQVFSENRLFLRCQKITSIDIDKGHYTHYEILLGITDEDGKTIAPDNFIPAVERCQRMSEVDRWVILAVFDWIEKHSFDFEMLDGFSINLSGESVNSEDFLDFLKSTLADSDIALDKITFEITETVAAGNIKFVQKFIKEIKQFNCKFSLDDFGSGYSSYSYLKDLDVDYLKIDGAFVKDILNNDADVAIVKSMNDIAHSLGLETIAEYVESTEILELLREMNVDFAQGWGIQKPILLADLV